MNLDSHEVIKTYVMCKQEITYIVHCIGYRCHGVDSRVLQYNFCEERLGLPCTSPSQFQMAPVAPPQGAAGPRNQDGGTSGNCIKERGENAA